jgi:hypothetical protein
LGDSKISLPLPGKSDYIIVGMGITEGFTDRMEEILTVDENKGTFYEGFNGHNPSSKKNNPVRAFRRVGRGAITILIIGK